MAIGWLSVLKMVPWGDVISTAPKVADGAMKLWSAVSKKPPVADLPTPDAQPRWSPETPSMALLEARMAAAEAEVSDLHHQMLESSELIKALADQNAQLIKRIEVNRVRLRWLTVITAVAGIAAAIGLAMTFAR